MSTVIALDPGDTTGITVFEDDKPVKLLQLDLDSLMGWLMNYEGPVETVIYEKFVVFRQKAVQQTGSKMKVSQAIGMIKMFAKGKNAHLVEQKPDIKPLAIKWFGIKMPGSHSQSHQYDALLHGLYWLHSQKRVKTLLEQEAANG